MQKIRRRYLFVGEKSFYDEYVSGFKAVSPDICLICCRYPGHQDTRFGMENLIKGNRAAEVHFEQTEDGVLTDMLSVCAEMGVCAKIISPSRTLSGKKKLSRSREAFTVTTVNKTGPGKAALFLKSALDIIFAAIAIVLLSPLFLIIAIAVKLDSAGPVFFKQVRAGRGGAGFEMYKFRSMETGAEIQKASLMHNNRFKSGHMFKLDDDPRITRVGRFIRKASLDELPQLINVLRREMSLVGPRPPTMDELENYERRHWRRFSVMPGMTGLWQISGRSDIRDFDRVVELDCEYIDNWSFLHDMEILLKTPAVVISRRGAR